MKRRDAAGQLVRGWEVFGHFFQMTKKSLVRHVALAGLVGAVLGGAWFYNFSLTKAEQTQLSAYARCTISSSLRGRAHVGSYPRLGGELSHGRACSELAGVFGGRTLVFLARQALGRVLACALAAFVALAALALWYGRRLHQTTRLRGARIVDVAVERRRAMVRAVAGCVGCGTLLGTLFMALTLGGERLGLVADYVFTAILTAAPGVAGLVSLDGDGQSVWYSLAGERGFHHPNEVYTALHAVFGGHSVARLGVEWLLRSLALSLIPAALLAAFASRRRGDLVLAGVPIPRAVESYHMLFWGSPGSGKSTAIKELLDQIRARGEKAILYDISAEYIERYLRPDRDHILNPLDARSLSWSPWADATRPEDFTRIAKSLFPRGGKDPFWNDASAQLFANALALLGRDPATRTNHELAQLLLHSDVTDIYEQLEKSVGARFMHPDAGAMPTNLLANMAATLGVWEILRDADKPEGYFSIRDFVNDDSDRWLFLSTRQDQHDMLKPLLSLWCDLAASAVLSMPPGRARRTWIILDEVASLQRLPALPLLLERGRKHGAACMLGVQSMAQLREIYGRDGAAALASHPQTWLCLRTVEPDTARWLEGALGSVEQDEAHESISMGASPHRDGVSIQESTRKRELVMATELINLPDLCGYLSLPGEGPIYQVRYDHEHRQPSPNVNGYEPLEGEGHADHRQRDQPGPGGDVLRERGLLSAQGGPERVAVVGQGRAGPRAAGDRRSRAVSQPPSWRASGRHHTRGQV